MDVLAKLEQLSDYKQAYAAEMEHMNDQRSMVMSKVQPELDAIGAEFTPRLTEASSKISLLEAEVKLAVEELQKTQKGTRLQAVYTKGRTSWDTERLTGYSVAHPEILQFCKVGEPSVAIREVKTKE